MLRSVPPDRAPAVAGCAENQKLLKINARVIRTQAGVGRIAMRPAKHNTYLPFYLVLSGKSGSFLVFHGSSVLRSD